MLYLFILQQMREDYKFFFSKFGYNSIQYLFIKCEF